MPDSTLYPSSQANESSVGTIDWELGFENVYTDDDGFINVELADGEQSHYLIVTGFGAAIPLDATITEVTFRVYVKANIDGGSYPALDFVDVKVVKSGVIVGVGASSSPSFPTSESVYPFPVIAGGMVGSVTPAEANHSGFGIALSVSAVGGIFPALAEIDYVTITVSYTSLTGGDIAARVITLPVGSRDEEPGKPRTIYAFAGDVILDPVVDDYYGGAVAVLRPVRVDGDDDDRRPLLSYVSASDFTESAVFAWQPQCLVSWLPDDDADELRGRRGAVTAPALVIAYESDCACFGSVVKGPSGNGTVTKLEAVDTQTSRNGTVVKGPSGSGTVSKPLCGC